MALIVTIGILGLTLGVVVIFVVGVVSSLARLGRAVPAEGFQVSDPSCAVVSATQALVAVQVAPLESDGDPEPNVHNVNVSGGLFHGAGTLDAGADLAELDEEQWARLTSTLYDDRAGFSVPDDTVTAVLRIERSPGQDVTLDGFDLMFSRGEVGLVQHVPLRMEWSGGCVASLD